MRSPRRKTRRLKKTWRVLPSDEIAEKHLSAALGVTPLTARLLLNRGYADADEAAHFLYPKLEDLHDPFLMKDMDAAVARLRQALFKKEKILVHGDFDVDGVTSTTLLLRMFRMLQADVSPYIPDRLTEGYGLSPESVARFAEEGVKLLVTVDCGVTAREAISQAREKGMDVIVTDHHEPTGALPDAVAVLDPKRSDAAYPFRDLAGVGVVFKLAWALARDASPSGKLSEELKLFLWDVLALVAMGTVADVVPLKGENRILVKFGLQALARTRHPGERALLSVTSSEKPTAHDLAFRIGPRINAAGRMGKNELALGILLSDSYEAALDMAKDLDRLNRKRQEVEQDIFNEALTAAEKEGLCEEAGVVLAGEGWHPGVIGIVASKLVEAFHRPVVLVCLDGDAGRGSARSVPALHLHSTLTACADFLTSYGGHSQAAGLTLKTADMGAFTDAFTREARARLSEADFVPEIQVEAEIRLNELRSSLLSEVALFQPFGMGNPEPVLAIREGRVAGKPRKIGSGGRHVSFYFRDGDSSRRAVAFGWGDLADDLERANLDIAFVPTINRFRGRENLELHIQDMRITGHW